MSSHLTNVRYGYFDALRGMTMILVVLSHVFLFSFGYCPTINLFFCTFRMPLFFFVSGYFAFKSVDIWNKEKIKDILLRKVKVQVVGAAFCCLVFSVLINRKFPDIKELLYASNEYWFTFVLFRLFIIYIAFVGIAKLTGHSSRLFWIITLGFTAFSIAFHFAYPYLKLPRFLNQVVDVILPRTFYYFPYFVLGMVARAQIGRFEAILRNNWLKTGMMLSVIVIWGAIMLRYIPRFSTGISYGFEAPLAYPLGIATLLIVIQFFYTNRENIERDNAFNRSLKFIGRRTLDIYFFHFFFVPRLKALKPLFKTYTYNSVFMQLTIGLSITLVIVGLALLVGQIIRMSPILSEWLLGVKRHKPLGDSQYPNPTVNNPIDLQ